MGELKSAILNFSTAQELPQDQTPECLDNFIGSIENLLKNIDYISLSIFGKIKNTIRS